jgi:hypothetical protein
MPESYVTFTGRSKFQTDNPLARGPFESAFSFQLSISEDRTIVKIADLGSSRIIRSLRLYTGCIST